MKPPQYRHDFKQWLAEANRKGASINEGRPLDDLKPGRRLAFNEARDKFIDQQLRRIGLRGSWTELDWLMNSRRHYTTKVGDKEKITGKCQNYCFDDNQLHQYILEAKKRRRIVWIYYFQKMFLVGTSTDARAEAWHQALNEGDPVPFIAPTVQSLYGVPQTVPPPLRYIGDTIKGIRDHVVATHHLDQFVAQALDEYMRGRAGQKVTATDVAIMHNMETFLETCGIPCSKDAAIYVTVLQKCLDTNQPFPNETICRGLRQ
jgi:hypothetical protein